MIKGAENEQNELMLIAGERLNSAPDVNITNWDCRKPVNRVGITMKT